MIQYKVGFFVCIFFGVMPGGLKNFFFSLQVYIYLTLFKYMYAYGKQGHLTLSHQFV